MYTPKVGENTVYNSPPFSKNSSNSSLLALVHSLFHSSRRNSLTTAEKTVCSKRIAAGLELKYVWLNLNMEGKLKRTEAALPLCCANEHLVKTVAFQIHVNRRPVLCVALYWWSPL